ncbi:esterase family protein [Virgibacillus sp. MSP4-1]|uniref:alpha/beta hydrolase n=1 Tax=Virgibacillus sp. MSP4-1 TaxID=2700081 RepID=UPI0003A4C9A0|nr:alpha/beta hydrolase-fold protein [Virgibacillus sp. MSP4-1]QHS21711.1 esterase family protein [Virgibacillus sp. MSP4-1]
MGRKGTMFDRDIHSQYLNETITIRIYQPENFSTLYKYHICIMQDGNDYYQLGRAATLSDRLHEKGEIHHTIFVGIHYNDKYDRQAKYHPDGHKNDSYIKFLRFEVVPLLDDILPGYYLGSARTLMGDSLGGTVSFLTALTYPNTFGNVIMQSPYVNKKVLEAAKASDNLSLIKIYHTIGEEETEVQTTTGGTEDFLEPNRQLRKVLQTKTSAYTYNERPGGHTWKTWQKDLPDAIISTFGK